jgi:Zn-dependent peptidase ImmA (M78 family)
MVIINAKTAAQAILDDYWDGNFPVNVMAISQSLGVGVLGIADDDTVYSGAYYPHHPENNNRPTIIINDAEPSYRQRFTMAHELGHHVMHGYQSFRDQLHFAVGREPKEIEANNFAANLLMPEFEFRTLVESGRYNASELANIFGVSPSAFSMRLKNMGYHD